jgi:hypothetical protein
VTPTPAPTPPPAPTAEAVVEEEPQILAPPERPAEMDRVDEVGAVAAAEYFLELSSYVFATGDLEEWKRISADNCGFCASVRQDIEEVYGAGERYVGGAITTDGGRVVGIDQMLAIYGVELPFTAASGQRLDAQGREVEDIAADQGYFVLDVIPASDRGWVLLAGVVRDVAFG